MRAVEDVAQAVPVVPGWIWLAAAVVVAVVAWAFVTPRPVADGDCPTCGHPDVAPSGRCSAVDDANGWASDVCECEDAYHQVSAESRP